MLFKAPSMLLLIFPIYGTLLAPGEQHCGGSYAITVQKREMGLEELSWAGHPRSRSSIVGTYHTKFQGS